MAAPKSSCAAQWSAVRPLSSLPTEQQPGREMGQVWRQIQ